MKTDSVLKLLRLNQINADTSEILKAMLKEYLINTHHDRESKALTVDLVEKINSCLFRLDEPELSEEELKSDIANIMNEYKAREILNNLLIEYLVSCEGEDRKHKSNIAFIIETLEEAIILSN